MPLLVDKPIGKSSRLALWEITETSDELLDILDCQVDPEALKVNELLKKQRISTRILLNSIEKGLSAFLTYTPENKPFLGKSYLGISISHSHTIAGILLCKTTETGLDIELIQDRIERIANRFMHETELKSLDTGHGFAPLLRKEILTVYWCAKEALYKYYGKRELDFKKQIRIDSFTAGDSGNLTGHLHTPAHTIDLTMGFEKIGNYMLVYVKDMA